MSSSLSGHLGCSPVLAVVNSAAMNTRVQSANYLYLHIFIFNWPLMFSECLHLLLQHTTQVEFTHILTKIFKSQNT